MKNVRRHLATADTPVARLARNVRARLRRVSLRMPLIIAYPFVLLYRGLRFAYGILMPIFITEPYFRARCRSVGKGLRTGVFLHWIQGGGDIIVGDWVRVDGKCTFSFAARFADRPTLKIGDYTSIGHDVTFVVGKEVVIGAHCHIASGTRIFDSSGHPVDPASRLAGLPPSPDDVKPVHVGDNVWIGTNCTVFPGVRIGSGSVVATASVVTADVPPNTMVAGYPARRIALLKEPTKENGE